MNMSPTCTGSSWMGASAKRSRFLKAGSSPATKRSTTFARCPRRSLTLPKKVASRRW